MFVPLSSVNTFRKTDTVFLFFKYEPVGNLLNWFHDPLMDHNIKIINHKFVLLYQQHKVEGQTREMTYHFVWAWGMLLDRTEVLARSPTWMEEVLQQTSCCSRQKCYFITMPDFLCLVISLNEVSYSIVLYLSLSTCKMETDPSLISENVWLK